MDKKQQTQTLYSQQLNVIAIGIWVNLVLAVLNLFLYFFLGTVESTSNPEDASVWITPVNQKINALQQKTLTLQNEMQNVVTKVVVPEDLAESFSLEMSSSIKLITDNILQLQKELLQTQATVAALKH